MYKRYYINLRKINGRKKENNTRRKTRENKI